MENNFENFTPRAMKTMELARKEADRLNHNFLGTEHVLLGMLKLKECIACRTLQKFGLELDTIRLELEKKIGTGPDQKIIGNIPYAPRVKKVLWLARKEGKALDHPYVGTEHILLGILKENDGVAAKVLKDLDIDLEKCRLEVLKVLEASDKSQEKQANKSQTEVPEDMTDFEGFSTQDGQTIVKARCLLGTLLLTDPEKARAMLGLLLRGAQDYAGQIVLTEESNLHRDSLEEEKALRQRILEIDMPTDTIVSELKSLSDKNIAKLLNVRQKANTVPTLLSRLVSEEFQKALKTSDTPPTPSPAAPAV